MELEEILKSHVICCETAEDAIKVKNFAVNNGYTPNATMTDMNIRGRFNSGWKYILIRLSPDDKSLYLVPPHDDILSGLPVCSYDKFKELVSKCDRTLGKYSMEELKKRVDNLKQYIIELCGERECTIDISVNVGYNDCTRQSLVGKSEIKIAD